MDDDIDMLDLDGLFNASNTENDILFDLDMSNPLQNAASFMEGDINELPTPALEEESTKSTSAKQAGVTSNSKLKRKRGTRKDKCSGGSSNGNAGLSHVSRNGDDSEQVPSSKKGQTKAKPKPIMLTEEQKKLFFPFAPGPVETNARKFKNQFPKIESFQSDVANDVPTAGLIRELYKLANVLQFKFNFICEQQIKMRSYCAEKLEPEPGPTHSSSSHNKINKPFRNTYLVKVKCEGLEAYLGQKPLLALKNPDEKCSPQQQPTRRRIAREKDPPVTCTMKHLRSKWLFPTTPKETINMMLIKYDELDEKNLWEYVDKLDELAANNYLPSFCKMSSTRKPHHFIDDSLRPTCDRKHPAVKITNTKVDGLFDKLTSLLVPISDYDSDVSSDDGSLYEFNPKTIAQAENDREHADRIYDVSDLSLDERTFIQLWAAGLTQPLKPAGKTFGNSDLDIQIENIFGTLNRSANNMNHQLADLHSTTYNFALKLQESKEENKRDSAIKKNYSQMLQKQKSPTKKKVSSR